MKEASAMALGEAWSCFCNVELLQAMTDVCGGPKTGMNVSDEKGNQLGGRSGCVGVDKYG